MADTYTPYLNLTKPEIGGDPDTWGQLINDDLDKIDANAAANMPKAGGTFTGPITVPDLLTVKGSGGFAGVVINVKNSDGTTYAPRIQTGSDASGGKYTGFVNGANNAYNLQVFDAGQVSIPRGNLQVGSAAYQGDGNVVGPIWGGGALSTWLNNNKVTRAGDTMFGRLYFSQPGWQADMALHNWRSGQDVWVYLRARDSGGLDIINSAYNAVVWECDNGGNTTQNGALYFRNGARLQQDGNIVGGGMPYNDLFTAINNKVSNQSQVQWARGVGIMELSSYVDVAINFPDMYADAGAPWVMIGLHKENSNTRLHPRVMWLQAN
ncbi:hypothetical protein KTD13_01900 [Burkholderia multivorans]|uniref:hypothetical protein n=1 Tax=Burkholderia multivorans TaxID=87883 RepID=UPI001C213AB7|nr:hypothetical protein [Burkholderia multivorans]MBU9259100.1 hypothetical protein [Burkholderia multivorans]